MINLDKKIKEYRYCKKCGKKLDLEDLAKRGYIEKVGQTEIIYCPYCDYEEII